MTKHWTDLANNTSGLKSLYSSVPSLNLVRLRSIHLNWQGPTVTARIDLPEYPDNAPPEWIDRSHDTLQIHLQFVAVENLSAHGWIPSSPVSIEFMSQEERRLQACITGDGLELSLACSDSFTVGHVSSFRSTESSMKDETYSFLQPLDARRFTTLPDTHESTFYERI
ncbi:Imm50 family immunity protein [Streptomyces sp. NPDC057554]|uniref:Imm50 family immunity protein n=1 Tax=Streptomyces sp. NPDC057554 TaxID=3350538 RepID=UPI0036952796